MQEQAWEQLTFFPAGSPASRSVLPGSAEAVKMTVSSGLKCSELSKKSGPVGCLEKMLLGSSIWNSTMRLLTWKAKATKQRRLYYRLAASVPRTSDTEWQLWATPNTMDYLPQRSPESLRRLAEVSRKGAKRPSNLREQVNPETCRMWPTPKASDYKGSGSAGSKSAEHDLKHGNLKGAVMYAPPQARDFRTGQAERWNNPDRSRNLNDQVAAMFPTPTTGAGLCGGSGSYQQLKALETSGTITQEERRSMSAGNGGQLNPEWVEWLMGFPIEWTD